MTGDLLEADTRMREAELRTAELEAVLRHLRHAVRESKVAIFSLVVAPSGRVDDSHVESMNLWGNLGYEEPSSAPAHALTLRVIHPEDRAAFEELLRGCLAGERDHLELELRVRHRDGHELWHLVRGATMRDEAGRALRVLGTGIDITELKAVESQLREAKLIAEAANRAKDEFLANVSHEIRTPMNAILGMTELVLDTSIAEPQRRSLLTVRSAARGLLDIINDLLDFSKIQTGQTRLEDAPFSLRAAFGETMRALATRAHRKGLELVYDVAADVPDSLIGDAGRIRQIVLNVVGNAIKFTEQGEVVVGVETGGTNEDGRVLLRLTVRDTGIGIAASKFDAIFRAFEQEDMSTTRRYGGTGLGLTIASRLVGLMNGSITVESKVGYGSTFTCTMALALGPAREARSPQASLERLHGLRVLVVDDNEVNRQILDSWLRASQFEPTSVGDAVAAMDSLFHAVASGKPYPVILLDARMPDTDGLTLAGKIRERAELAASRIIVLSSGDRPGELARFRALGVEAHLLKPVTHEELLETIRVVMTRARTLPT